VLQFAGRDSFGIATPSPGYRISIRHARTVFLQKIINNYKGLNFKRAAVSAGGQERLKNIRWDVENIIDP
jgi:hypothetical protein